MGEVDQSLEGANIGTIIGTGLLLGIVHVLTGPDHLSALIVLSAGSSWRSCELGMRWGAGHSTGLIVVTAIFLALDQNINLDKVGTYCDFVVGMLMVLLGCWGMHHYLKVRKEYQQKAAMAEIQRIQGNVDILQSPRTPDGGAFQLQTPDAIMERGHHGHGHGHGHAHDGKIRKESFDETIVTRKCCFGLCNAPSSDIKNKHTAHWTAFAYGIAHGLAGTGGVLGVLPAVVLNDWGRSSAYLLSFCIASIFIMGAFAAVYGELTGRLVQISDKLLYRVGIFSASVSLTVGVLWIILVSTGTLDKVFG